MMTNENPDAMYSKEDLENFRTLLNEEKEKLLKKAKQTVESGSINLDKNEMMDEVDLASAIIS